MGLIEWLTGAAEGVAEAVYNAFAWLVSALLGAVMNMAAYLLSLLPALPIPWTVGEVTNLMGPVAAWNIFIPIRESAFLFVSTLLFCVIYGVIRFVVSLIPTVG